MREAWWARLFSAAAPERGRYIAVVDVEWWTSGFALFLFRFVLLRLSMCFVVAVADADDGTRPGNGRTANDLSQLQNGFVTVWNSWNSRRQRDAACQIVALHKIVAHQSPVKLAQVRPSRCNDAPSRLVS